MLLSPVPLVSKLHRLATREQKGMQNWEPRVHQAPNKELSDLWKVPTREGYSISDPFKPGELAAALGRMKPEKSPGLGSILPEFILHAGLALKSWFCDFLTSCMHQLKIPETWEEC